MRSVKLKRVEGVVCHHCLSHLYSWELSSTHSGDKNNIFFENEAEVDAGTETSYPALPYTAEHSEVARWNCGRADAVLGCPYRRAAESTYSG